MAEAILTARDVSPEAEDEGSSRVKSKLQGRNLATSSSINDTYPSSNSPVFLMMASGQIESAEVYVGLFNVSNDSLVGTILFVLGSVTLINSRMYLWINRI